MDFVNALKLVGREGTDLLARRGSLVASMKDENGVEVGRFTTNCTRAHVPPTSLPRNNAAKTPDFLALIGQASFTVPSPFSLRCWHCLRVFTLFTLRFGVTSNLNPILVNLEVVSSGTTEWLFSPNLRSLFYPTVRAWSVSSVLSVFHLPCTPTTGETIAKSKARKAPQPSNKT